MAVPVAIYVGWWLWALSSDFSSESQIALDDALLFPSWAFQSLSAALGALTGLDFDFTYGDRSTLAAGPTLAVLALVGIGWRLRRGSVPKALWAALAIVLGLWLMGAVTKGLSDAGQCPLPVSRSPDGPDRRRRGGGGAALEKVGD